MAAVVMMGLMMNSFIMTEKPAIGIPDPPAINTTRIDDFFVSYEKKVLINGTLHVLYFNYTYLGGGLVNKTYHYVTPGNETKSQIISINNSGIFFQSFNENELVIKHQDHQFLEVYEIQRGNADTKIEYSRTFVTAWQPRFIINVTAFQFPLLFDSLNLTLIYWNITVTSADGSTTYNFNNGKINVIRNNNNDASNQNCSQISSKQDQLTQSSSQSSSTLGIDMNTFMMVMSISIISASWHASRQKKLNDQERKKTFQQKNAKVKDEKT